MKTEKKFIIITSIFGPTEAVLAFSKMKDYTLVVVADKKTPADWQCDNVHYLSVDKQGEMGFNIIPLLKYNIYQRKMIGYIYAMQQGATVIIDTDDDNIPLDGWDFPALTGSFDSIEAKSGFVNIYELYSDQHIWPRGLPLGNINKRGGLEAKIQKTECNIGIWQGLADEDPDVDAIYRLTNDEPCYFKDRAPVVLKSQTICPFNTQNTYVRQELFPLLYLPAHVTFRFCDILKGMVAQPIMWLYGYELGFTKATVVQKRNPHDYFKDFISEIPMYEYTQKALEITHATVTRNNDIKANLYNTYEALLKNGIVIADEITMLEAWLKDL
jgi:hypothetical protein